MWGWKVLIVKLLLVTLSRQKRLQFLFLRFWFRFRFWFQFRFRFCFRLPLRIPDSGFSIRPSFLALYDGKFAPCCTRCKQKPTSKPFLDAIRSEDQKWSIFDFFAIQQGNQGLLPLWPSLDKTQIQNRGKPSNFHHTLFFKQFYCFNHFQLNQMINYFVHFFPFPTQNPLVYTIW